MSFFKRLLGIEKRRYKRVSCDIKSKFVFVSSGIACRGEARILDITVKGICYDHVHIYNTQVGFQLKVGQVVDVYFAAPRETDLEKNYHLKGKVRSILHKGTYGRVKRFGVMLIGLDHQQKKDLSRLISYFKAKNSE